MDPSCCIGQAGNRQHAETSRRGSGVEPSNFDGITWRTHEVAVLNLDAWGRFVARLRVQVVSAHGCSGMHGVLKLISGGDLPLTALRRRAIPEDAWPSYRTPTTSALAFGAAPGRGRGAPRRRRHGRRRAGDHPSPARRGRRLAGPAARANRLCSAPWAKRGLSKGQTGPSAGNIGQRLGCRHSRNSMRTKESVRSG